jgi:SET domain-containing protein
MKTSTDEFSFVLKPAEHGIGVFAVHAIAAGTHLRLWASESRELKTEQVPEALRCYCIKMGKTVYAPRDFGAMDVGWFLNHSQTPNAHHREFEYYASRDIAAGEEITIDYNSLGEPEELKEDYYKSRGRGEIEN